MRQTAQIPVETLETVYAAARSHVRTSRLTDLEFIYTPAQIALATFRLSNTAIVDSWLGVKQDKKKEHEHVKGKGKEREGTADEAVGDGTELDAERVVDLLVEIGEAILEAKENPVDKAKVTEVDKRLRWARNPEKDPKSAL